MFRQLQDLLGRNRSRGSGGLLGRILGGSDSRGQYNDRYDDRRRYDDDDDRRSYGGRRRRRDDDDDDD